MPLPVIVLLFILLPFAFGCLAAVYLGKWRRFKPETIELLEFVLLSVSILVLIVDAGEFQNVAQLKALRVERAEKSDALFAMADPLLKSVCTQAAARLQQRIVDRCGASTSRDIEEIEKYWKCEEAVKKRPWGDRLNCEEFQELHERWKRSAWENTYFRSIPNVTRFSREHHDELWRVSKAIDVVNDVHAQIVRTESPETKQQTVISDFLSKAILTCIVAFGLGIGVARRLRSRNST